MAKITEYQRTTRTQFDINTTKAKIKKMHNNIALIKVLRGVKMCVAYFNKSPLKFSLKKNNLNHLDSWRNKYTKQTVTSKVTRDFINQKLVELHITEKAKKDPCYARQACDAVLASVYSNKKDFFCKKMISRNIDISEYIREAGDAAKQAGLEGKMHDNIFVPAGAGANPFLTPIISSVQLKFPRVFLNKNQQAFFRVYAERKISCEVGKICKDRGIISPIEFGAMLDKIASRGTDNLTGNRSPRVD